MQGDDATRWESDAPVRLEPAGEPPTRVAVIVVHGVADQKPGETALAFVDLMVASSNDRSSYEVIGGGDDLVLPVEPMSNALPFSFDDAPPAVPSDATPFGRERPLLKSLAQSMRSDFQSGAADDVDAEHDWRAVLARVREWLRHPFTPTPVPDEEKGTDRGLRFTRYLLGKATRNHAPPESYATRRIDMRRVSGGHAQRVDVHELYWADLSRLSSAVPSIVTEFFTMLFRLSRLGRDTVDEASRYADSNVPERSRRWAWLSALQTFIDWMFTNVLAQLFAHLLLAGLLVMAIGALSPKPVVPPPGLVNAWTAHAIGVCVDRNRIDDLCDRKLEDPKVSANVLPFKPIGIAVAAAGFFAMLYFAIHVSRGRAMGVAGVVVVLGALIAVVPWLGVSLTLLAGITAAYLSALRAADDRFPLVFVCGATGWAIIVGASVSSRFFGWHGPSPSPTDWNLAVETSLSAFEATLNTIKWWWIVMAVPIVAWVVSTTAVTAIEWRRGRYEGRASAATGRLGLLMSFSTFLIVTMALWAGLQTPLKLAVAERTYAPMFTWQAQPHDPVPLDQQAWVMTCAEPSTSQTAAQFLECRFRSSTNTASFIALVLLLVILYLVVTVVPSVLAELRLVSSDRREEARRLGRWLTWFYRHADRCLLLLTIAGGLAAFVVGLLFFFGIGADDAALLEFIATQSDRLLRWFVIPTASVFAALSLFGRFISRNLPGLRAPLDAALDVDNHLREFPRQQIPRARIFARYRALLDHVRRQGYQRIVVVSHSQGTVISAEFLRFIASEDFTFNDRDRAPRLRRLLGCDLHLLTLGCPLRQLYAARFPTLYCWVIGMTPTRSGPSAGDVGAARWVNAFGSGDYVGRWLWSHPVQANLFHPLNDALCAPDFGRRTTYDPFHPMPPSVSLLASHREYETCVGFAAHTHYFDPPRALDEPSIVAALADQLLA